MRIKYLGVHPILHVEVWGLFKGTELIDSVSDVDLKVKGIILC